MQVIFWPLSRFVAYGRELRKNDKAVDRMVASIREFGFKIPVLARSNGVVDGHLRLKAAQKLGLKDVVPATSVDYLGIEPYSPGQQAISAGGTLTSAVAGSLERYKRLGRDDNESV